MRLMQSSVDCMIVCTCIRCIFYFHILDKDKVLNDLNSFDLAIFAEKLFDGGLIHIVQSTNVQLSYQNALMYLLSRMRLISEFFLFGFWHLCVNLEDLRVVVDGVVADGESYLVFPLFGLALIVVLGGRPFFSRSASAAPFPVALIAMILFFIMVISMIPISLFLSLSITILSVTAATWWIWSVAGSVVVLSSFFPASSLFWLASLSVFVPLSLIISSHI